MEICGRGGGVMMDREISRKLKEKVLDSCVVQASRPYTYGLETLALPGLQQHKLKLCENKSSSYDFSDALHMRNIMHYLD